MVTMPLAREAMVRIAIVDPFSGVAGDMLLGALLDLGVEEAWLRSLPATLALEGIVVRIARVQRGEIASVKVDFDVPPQPHGRHLRHIRAIVEAAAIPDVVKAEAMAVFRALTEAEATVHGTAVEQVHLHEVGAVDAILDVVGTVWAFHLLGVERIHCGTIALGDGFVNSAHGRLPVPAPATLRLLEGLEVHAGPPDSGELTTPTGAALMKVLAQSGAPESYCIVRSGYGAGTRVLKGRANAVRIVLADSAVGARSAGGDAGTIVRESLVVVAADIDDMSGEYVADLADLLRERGALDVTLVQTLMKKGRPGVRVEVLCGEDVASVYEDILLLQSTTIGVRRIHVVRRSLPRSEHTIEVFGQPIAVKSVVLPDGTERAKAEFEDVKAVARRTGRTTAQVLEEIVRSRQ